MRRDLSVGLCEILLCGTSLPRERLRNVLYLCARHKYLEVVLVIITKSEEFQYILFNSGSHCLQKDLYVSISDFSGV